MDYNEFRFEKIKELVKEGQTEEPSRADWARRIRERSGLSRRTFGEKYGINPKTIEAWEYGYGNPQE